MHADDVGPRLTESRFGQFHRLTQPGTYHVSVSQRNYVAQTRSVTVGTTGWTTADFALQPEATAVGEAEAEPSTQMWLRLPNPAQCGQTIKLSLPRDAHPATVELFDLSGRRVALLGRQLATGTEHALRLPGHLADGVYLLRAQAGDSQQVARLVLLD
jgi:hypothetical protein